MASYIFYPEIRAYCGARRAKSAVAGDSLGILTPLIFSIVIWCAVFCVLIPLRNLPGLHPTAAWLLAVAAALAMALAIPLGIAFLVALLLRARSKKVGELRGVPVYWLGPYTRPPGFRAFTLPPFKAIFVVGDPPERVLRHELRHIEQGKKITYLRAIPLGLVFIFLGYPAPWVATAVSIGLLVFLFILPYISWTLERDADIHGFENAENYKRTYKAVLKKRPKSRLMRFLRWISTHPPWWVRASERYYDRRVSTLRLFLEDVFSR